MPGNNVTATLSVKDRNFSSSMEAAIGRLEDFEKAADSSSGSMTKMGAAFGVASGVIESAMRSISGCVEDAVNRFDTLNRFPKVMEQIGFNADDASKATEKLTEGIQGLPTSLSEITANTQSLALLTGDLEEATELSIALNDAFLASGASGEDAARGLTQYTQMLSSGKVDMQSWRTLLETMGVALTDVANEFGYTGETAKSQLYSALQDGTITFDEFNKTLINLDQGLSTVDSSFVSFADRALTASEGIGTSMQNIKTAIVTGLSNIMNSVDNALQSAGMGTIAQSLNGLKDVVKDVFNTISTVVGSVVSVVAPVFKNLAENTDLVAVSVGALATKFIALKIIDSVRSKVNSFRTAVKTSSETIKKYNSLLEKYGSKQKAIAAAEEAVAKAKEIAEKAAKAQSAADEAALVAKQKYTEAMKVENDALKAGMTAQKAKEAAMKANTAATDAQIVAEQKKIAAETLNMQATQAAATAEQTQAAAQTLSNTQISLKTALLGVLSGQTSIATAAQQAFNAALKANPIGFVITAVTTLISVFSGLAAMLGGAKTEAQEYAEEQEEVRKSISETAEETAKSTQEHENNIEASKINADQAAELADEITQLQGDIEKANKAEKDSSEMKSELKTKINQLNSVLGDTAYEYDEATNSLSASTEEIKAYIKQAQKQEEVNELLEIQSENYDELAKAQATVSEAQAKIDEATKESEKVWNDYYAAFEKAQTQTEMDQLVTERETKLNDLNEVIKASQETIDQTTPTIEDYKKTWEEASEKVTTAQGELTTAQEELNTVVEESGSKYSALTTAAVQAAAQQYAANQQMIANGQILYEQLSEKNQALVDSLNETWNMYYEANTNMWEQLKDDSNLSVQQMIDNMIANQTATEEMAANLGNLRNTFASLGLDTAVLDQLENLGFESANEIANLAAATPEQLQAFVSAYEAGGAKAGENLTTGLGTAAENLPPAIQNLVGTMEQGLSEQIAAADWAELGEAEIQGIVEGIEGMTDDAVTAVTDAATEQYKGYKSEIQSGSPSKVYAGYGEDQMTGIMLGIKNKKAQLLDLMRSVATQIQSPFRNLSGTFRNYGAYAMQGFINGLNGMRSSVISTARSIANAASNTIADALVIGSPSKLLEKFGAWTGEGFDNGLAKMIRPIERTATQMADVMTSVFIPRISDHKFSGKFAIAGEYSYSIDGLRDDINELAESIQNRPIILNSDLSIDGRSFARTTTPYITAEQKSNKKFSNYMKGIK